MCLVFPKMATRRKSKYEDENGGFCQEWEEAFAFIEISGKPLCVVCNTVLNHFKVRNHKLQYDTNHGYFHCEYDA